MNNSLELYTGRPRLTRDHSKCRYKTEIFTTSSFQHLYVRGERQYFIVISVSQCCVSPEWVLTVISINMTEIPIYRDNIFILIFSGFVSSRLENRPN